VLVVHGTRKFLERVGSPSGDVTSSTTKLGAWYATALFWRPQVALFVNETTLLPVFVRLAPASAVVARFRADLGDLLLAHRCPASFVEQELEEMQDHVLDKTRSRSVLGVMNEFVSLAGYQLDADEGLDLFELSLSLAETPCGPLYKTDVSPDRALAAIAGSVQNDLLRRRKR